MQGVFINGRRCETKKLLKAVAKANPQFIELIATSIFGNEYGGPLDEAPADMYFVTGPDPATSRKWYAQIIVTRDPFTVKVK